MEQRRTSSTSAPAARPISVLARLTSGRTEGAMAEPVNLLSAEPRAAPDAFPGRKRVQGKLPGGGACEPPDQFDQPTRWRDSWSRMTVSSKVGSAGLT